MNHILNVLAFYVKQGKGNLYSYSKRCTATKKAIKSLEKRGYLTVNEFHQACWTGKMFN